MTANSKSLVSGAEIEVLRVLASRELRPNVLIHCHASEVDGIIAQLQTVCAGPLCNCQLPGALDPSPGSKGTLLLNDVAALTIPQQVLLFDWLGQHRGASQVISITRKNLTKMVRGGTFLDDLFYRLNTVFVRTDS